MRLRRNKMFGPIATLTVAICLTFSLVLSGTFVGATPALASPEDDLAAASERLNSLGLELASLENSLMDQAAELEKSKYDIDNQQIKIDETNAELAVARAILSSRMRSGYKSGPVVFLEVLLNATSFDDLISRIYYMDKINTSDAEAIDTVQELEKQLEKEMGELESRQEDLVEQLNATQAQVNSYAAKVAEAQAYYNQLDAEVQAQLAEQAAREAEAQEGESSSLASALDAAQNGSSDPVDISVVNNDNNSNNSSTSGNNDSNNSNSNNSAAQSPNSPESPSNTESPASPTSPESPSTPSTPSTPTYNTYGGAGVDSAYSCIGCPYVWAAAGPNSFDCSGLVCYCYGYKRGRTTYSMIESLKADGSWRTSLSELNYGDLVFTHSGHVGIYIGNNQMIHAPSPGRTVCVQSLYEPFYGGGTY